MHNHLISVIVEQDVDSAHLAQRLVNHLLAVRLLLQVDSQEVNLAAIALNLLLRLLSILLLLRQVRNQRLCTLHGEENGRCLSYTAITYKT